jgi:LacI family transcriptional regulator
MGLGTHSAIPERASVTVYTNADAQGGRNNALAMTEQSRAVTIRDVARLAGVSVATVSRVHRGSAPVADPTRERVESAIAELGYTPSHLGRSLAERRHAALGIVFPDLSGPYFAEVIRGFEAEAATTNQAVLVLSTHGRVAPNEQVRSLAGRVDGLLILGRTVPDETIEDLQASGTAVVLLARPAVAGADSVQAENRQSAQALTEHIIRHGHVRLAFIGDPSSSPDGMERWEGFIGAHRVAGLPLPVGAIPTPYREQEGYQAASRLLVREDGATAYICANDEIALGAYAAIQETGLQVGRDIAVTGWDDVPVARHVSPPLTTVHQPMHELGALGARVLADRIAGEGMSGDRAPLHEVLATRLVIRASCGCGQAQGGTTR